MDPSPSRQTVFLFPEPIAAPTAAGMPYPIVALPEMVNSRCPFLMIIAWKEQTQALPLPETVSCPSGKSLLNSYMNTYGLTGVFFS